MQLTRDQTITRAMVDQDAPARPDAGKIQRTHELSSAIGGPQITPVVTRFEVGYDTVALFCSAGLTKHVPDEQICERLSTMKSAKQVCEDLLQDALDGGGSDNITILVARATSEDE